MKQKTYRRRQAGQTQCERIENYLAKRAGRWIAMPHLARVGAGTPQGFCIVHSRISDLRERGLQIDQESRWVEGRCLSFYRLVPV
jgi:hypothetical protein